MARPAVMKVALVSPYDVLHPGGVTTHVTRLCATLRDRGVDARVLAPMPADRAAPAHVTPLRGRITTVASAGARARITLDPRSVVHARAILAAERFDVVHLHNPLSPLVNLGVLASRGLVPASAFVATFHEFRERLEPVMELGKRLVRPWVDRLDARIAVSPVAAAFNRRRFPGRYTVVPNGVDVSRFARDGAPPRRDGRTVLFVGRLEPRKGFPHLLRAFARVQARVPDVRLVVVGPYDRATAAPLIAEAAALRLRGVEFAGAASDQDLPAWYAAADVFCAPSVGFESFGMVLLEAMAAGVPIVASDIPAFRGVVEHRRQGLLVPPARPDAIANAIERLLADPGSRRAMATAGRAAARRYDWSIVAGEVLDVYREAITARADVRVTSIAGAGASIPSSDP